MSIETLPLKKGEVAFTWFNNYSRVGLRTPTKTLVIDPADIAPEVFKKVDAVLITNEHPDHLDVNIIQEIHRRTQCIVAAHSTSTKRLRDAIAANKLNEMLVNKEIEIDTMTIKAEAFTHPAATPVSYLITAENEIKVYHNGDSLPHRDMRQIGERSPPEIVFCTVSPSAAGASPQSGLEIVRMVKPKVAVPYHAPADDCKRFAEPAIRKILT